MNTELKNKAAYDLAMEHIRQNNRMKEHPDVTLEEQIKHFKSVYNKILSYLDKE